MPQAKSITLTVGSESFVYKPIAVGGVTSWQQDGATSFGSANMMSVGIRDVTSSQTTRKGTLKFTEELLDEPAAGCCGPATSRGTDLTSFDFTFATAATAAERAVIYDKAVAALANADIRQSIINNERFWG